MIKSSIIKKKIKNKEFRSFNGFLKQKKNARLLPLTSSASEYEKNDHQFKILKQK